ncbi:hypothetical protein [Pseudomonas moorei]|uniref:hypothetical protein n=1 Tax=Pseudomonas moorei TaxID=395599 RepID=UPI001FF3DFC9|nr:hypothetical protein [Pseudomonas moorei]
MPISNTPNVFKQAVEYLRAYYAQEGIDVRPAHAHAVVAHYLGYNSKVALNSDPDFDPYERELVINHEEGGDVRKMREHIPRMQPTPLQTIDILELAEVIETGLTPPCDCCDTKRFDVRYVGSDWNHPEGWISLSCAEHDPQYDFCTFCGPSRPHYAEKINHRGECEEHDGESVYDDEEREDMDSYIEYIQNH